MKLIIQIPCYNEEEALTVTIKSLPLEITGIDKVEILVINDGSTDNTVQVAKALGVKHILDLPYHRGLAEGFRRGIEKSLELGADIIVNTDADNQYKGEDIPRLIKGIIDKKGEIIIGCRDISAVKHFSWGKKILQKLGSFVVRKFSKTDIPDTTSGFRAYSREAALRLNVFSTYTYTIETIIQAGRLGIPISYILISTNEKLRDSRLIKNIPSYIKKSVSTILRIYLMYEPFKSFFNLGLIPIIFSLLLIVRFLVAHFTKPQGGHIQSLIVAAIAFIIGTIIIMIGLLGDIISVNRKINEEILYRLRKREFGNNNL
ncbi:MAG: glycosyltransferase family 2 protein [Candidatus Omnitrophica bacterium]|jgi:glycosyltransferase involved in cell wall biosynthesis|nr:glycosyltransferase family 2 protein [Candidatus Omnitrophota bacterium]